MRPLLAIALLALALALAGCGGSNNTSSVLPDEEGGLYLALGDSIAEGENASDHERTDYVARVHEALIDHYGSIKLVSFATGGHTTQDLIDQQLPEAVELLRAGAVRVTSVTVGGNDLYVLAGDPDCLPDPAHADCSFEEILAGAAERLDTILRDLRAAGPDTAIVIELYPDLFSGSGHEFEGPAAFAFGRLNDVIEETAAAHGVIVADPRPAFAGRSAELTGILEPEVNFHPNDAGYARIAEAFLEALELP